MGTLYLIRHGQASYGEADYDRLSSRGQEQARAVGQWLAKARPDALYSGPHRRQVQTAEHAIDAANSLGVALPARAEVAELAEYPAFQLLQHFMPRLAREDVRFAALASSPSHALLDEAFRTILHKWATDEWWVDEVERVSAFVARVRAGLTRVFAAASSGARVAVVTSAGPIGVAVGLTLGIPEVRMVRQSVVVRNASVTELRFRTGSFTAAAEWHPEHVSLVTFNLTGHLPDELHTER